MSKKFKPCDTKKKHFCVNMKRFSSDQYSTGRRLFVGQSMNFDTGQTGTRVWYAYGSKSAEFVLCLFCPWCGGTLGWLDKKKAKKK